MRRKPGGLVPLETSILAAAGELQKAGVPEFHGYQLAKHLADVSDRKLLTAYGTLYRALGRLQKMGFLQSHWEDPQIAANENRPGRRLYALTGEGVALADASRQGDAPAKVAKRGRRRVAPA
jgi:PadR family transcriptional regulator PadR